MNMTEEQKYSVLLRELGEMLQSKNTTISCQQWQIEELQAKLADAEKERDIARSEWSRTTELLCKQRLEIEQLKGGAV